MTDAIAPAVAAPPARPLPAVNGHADAKKTASAFEAVFLGQMTQLMMDSVETGGEFSGGHGEEMFRGVLAEKLGTAMAARGGIGIAPLVMAQIIKMQGAGSDGQ